MQQLLNVIKQVKQTIQAYKSDLSSNEALTRYTLIDITLNALGWDVHSPALVFPEYTKGMNGGRADYALLGVDSKPVAIIEAKKLGNLTTQDLIQVTTYAFHSGIKYAAATDGNTWIVADAFKQVQFSQKEIMRFSFETEPENLLLIKLVSLMPTNLCSGGNTFFPVIQDTNLVLTNVTPVANIANVTPPRSIKKVDALAKAVNKAPMNDVGWRPLAKIEGSVIKPRQLKFPDGTTAPVNSTMSGMVKQIAEWLLKIQKLPQPPIRDYFGKTRFLINTVPVHHSGKDFKGKNALSNGWYLELNYSSSDQAKNIFWLLEQSGENIANYYFQ